MFQLYDGQSRVGLITFSGRARVERHLSEPANRDDIYAAITGLTYDGEYPYMPDALAMLTEVVGNNTELHIKQRVVNERPCWYPQCREIWN